jgi:hypothetical protein
LISLPEPLSIWNAYWIDNEADLKKFCGKLLAEFGMNLLDDAGAFKLIAKRYLKKVASLRSRPDIDPETKKNLKLSRMFSEIVI